MIAQLAIGTCDKNVHSKGVMNPHGVVGYDARQASPEMSRAFASGFMDGGGAMTSIGMVSSEYIYFICGKEGDRYDVGAMITASHNPDRKSVV